MIYTTQMDAAKKGIITKEMKVVAEYEGIDEAYAALQVLGYSKREIETAFTDVDFSNMNVEEIIKKGLILLTNNK